MSWHSSSSRLWIIHSLTVVRWSNKTGYHPSINFQGGERETLLAPNIGFVFVTSFSIPSFIPPEADLSVRVSERCRHSLLSERFLSLPCTWLLCPSHISVGHPLIWEEWHSIFLFHPDRTYKKEIIFLGFCHLGLYRKAAKCSVCHQWRSILDPEVRAASTAVPARPIYPAASLLATVLIDGQWHVS